ncbi:MAG: hypothetical protein HQK55_12190, partial [Deltaproteobacteria bacterium]|nr:hypothetical protein [Deltaproteobacteria bacterium]
APTSISLPLTKEPPSPETATLPEPENQVPLLENWSPDIVPGELSESGLNDKIVEMVSFYKARTGTKRKVRDLLHKDVGFEERDYDIIARDFEVLPADAAELVGILKDTFRKDGRFSRTTFQNNLPTLTRHGTKVFEFLWSYLKEIENREDRVAFLNAMQYLIAQLNQPKAAVEMLLAELVHPADEVSFHDRNCLMLANLLIRKYNKELTTDIEITPEEILLVQDGLNKSLTADISGLIDRERDLFYCKIQTIHQKTKYALDGRDSAMPLRYVFTLEREAYIYFSLVGGETAHAIVKSAINEYGDPDSEVYHLKNSKVSLKAMLQILQVAMRGMSRFKVPEDNSLLKLVISRQDTFMALAKDSVHHDQVRRVLRWAVC